MKMFSWNVNGLNSCIKKGFLFGIIVQKKYIDSFRYLNPNIDNAYTWWNVGKDSKFLIIY